MCQFCVIISATFLCVAFLLQSWKSCCSCRTDVNLYFITQNCVTSVQVCHFCNWWQPLYHMMRQTQAGFCIVAGRLRGQLSRTPITILIQGHPGTSSVVHSCKPCQESVVCCWQVPCIILSKFQTEISSIPSNVISKLLKFQCWHTQCLQEPPFLTLQAEFLMCFCHNCNKISKWNDQHHRAAAVH